MMNHLIRFSRFIAISPILLQCSFLSAASVNTDIHGTNALVINTAVYPEGIGYDSANKRYYVGSLTSPTIYQVNQDGGLQPFVTDPRIISSAGIHVDSENQQLLVTSLDLGTSTKTNKVSKGQLAGLGIYDLQTGKAIHYINLAKTLSGAHLANGITVDKFGNIYITDSSSPQIYKVDRDYHTSIFLKDTKFTGDGFNLNGIVYHEDGFLIVSKHNSNTLYRIPVNSPVAFEKIDLDYPLEGPDGLVLLSENVLAVIQNKSEGKVSFFKTSDGWKSARHTNSVILKNTYPTSGVVIEKGIAVIDGHINKLFSGQTDDVKNFSIIQLPDP